MPGPMLWHGGHRIRLRKGMRADSLVLVLPAGPSKNHPRQGCFSSSFRTWWIKDPTTSLNNRGSAVFVIQFTFTLLGESNALLFLQRISPSSLKPCGPGEMTLVLRDWVLRGWLMAGILRGLSENPRDSPAPSGMLQSHNSFHENTKIPFTFSIVLSFVLRRGSSG